MSAPLNFLDSLFTKAAWAYGAQPQAVSFTFIITMAFVFLAVGVLAHITFQFFMGFVTASSRGPREVQVVMNACVCPQCRNDIYRILKNEIASKSLSPAADFQIRCQFCKSDSVWIPISDPPMLIAFRPHGERTFRRPGSKARRTPVKHA